MTGAVRYRYKAARSSLVIFDAFSHGMARENAAPLGRTPVCIVWMNSSRVNVPMNGRGLMMAGLTDVAGDPVISAP